MKLNVSFWEWCIGFLGISVSRLVDGLMVLRKRRPQRLAGHMLKLCAAIGALSFSALVNAQAYFECGSVACSGAYTFDPWNNGATGIKALNVGGDLFDVTFTNTAPGTSPFVLSDTTAAPGQPLTGIDAGNALATFYATLPDTDRQDPGDPGPLLITALGPAGSLSATYGGATELFDAVATSVSDPSNSTPLNGVAEVSNPHPNAFINAQGQNIDVGNTPEIYTIWTPIATLAAPEIDPVSATSALTLLFGGLAVLRGRKRVSA